MRDVVLVQDVHPLLGGAGVGLTETVSSCASPFGDEQGPAIVHCRGGFIAQSVAVSGCVEVQGVGDVVVVD